MNQNLIIAHYLAQNFEKLHETQVNVEAFFIESLESEMNYFAIFNDIILHPNPVIIEGDGIVFPLFFYRNQETARLPLSQISTQDLLLNCFLLLSGWQEFAIKARDVHGRFRYQDSLQGKYQFGSIPVVSLLFKEIGKRIMHTGNECRIRKFSKSGSNIIISHDIDRIYSGWYEATGNLIRRPGFMKFVNWLMVSNRKLFKGLDDYEKGLLRLLEILGQHDIKSIFFLLANSSVEDADYSLNDRNLKIIKEKILNGGHLVGIHGGYMTFRDKKVFMDQLSQLSGFFSRQIFLSRQHFLKYDLLETPKILLECGIRTDYSLGFAESPGFRNSIATPFFSFDFSEWKPSSLVSVPLYFMDGTYSHYLKVMREDMTNPLESIMPQFETLNMNFSILFHNSVFTEFKYKGFEDLFLKIIQYCKHQNISTDAQLVWPEAEETA